jgi:hypothetical protein
MSPAGKGYRCLFLVLTISIFPFFSCTKTIHDRRSRATVTPDSREYFGCRVNGADFVSEASTGNVSGSCVYKSAYSDTTIKLFRIMSNNFSVDCAMGTVAITLDSIELKAGETYLLGSPGTGKNYARYSYVLNCSSDLVELSTSDNDDLRGKVTIKSIDKKKQVIKGTFFFTLHGNNGEFFQITDGIFDRHFTEY